MTESEYRERLNALEEQLTVLYRQRRKLTEAYADEHPAVLPPLRARSEHQQRISRCPRCSALLSAKEEV